MIYRYIFIHAYRVVIRPLLMVSTINKKPKTKSKNYIEIRRDKGIPKPYHGFNKTKIVHNMHSASIGYKTTQIVKDFFKTTWLA